MKISAEEKEKILQNLKISPRKKLEWLWKMNDFLSRSSSKRTIIRLRRLRDHS